MPEWRFWHCTPKILKAYSKAAEIADKRNDDNAWLYGKYVFDAVRIAIHNAFRDPKKGQKAEDYPSEPYGRKAEEQKREQEKVIEEVGYQDPTMLRLQIMEVNARLEQQMQERKNREVGKE